MATIKAKNKADRLNVRVKLVGTELLEEQELLRCTQKPIRGLLQPAVQNRSLIEYVGPAAIPLSDYLRQKLSAYDFNYIIAQIARMGGKLSSHHLRAEYLVKDCRYIYINVTTRELQFLYLPVPVIQQAEFRTLMETVATFWHPDSEATRQYVSQAYAYLHGVRDFRPETVLRLIQSTDAEVAAELRRHQTEQSGFITNKRSEYYEHYQPVAPVGAQPAPVAAPAYGGAEDTSLLEEAAVNDPATGLLPEQYGGPAADGTALLEEEPIGNLPPQSAGYGVNQVSETGVLIDSILNEPGAAYPEPDVDTAPQPFAESVQKQEPYSDASAIPMSPMQGAQVSPEPSYSPFATQTAPAYEMPRQAEVPMQAAIPEQPAAIPQGPEPKQKRRGKASKRKAESQPQYTPPQYAPQQYTQPEPQYAPQQPYAQPQPQYAPQQPYAQPQPQYAPQQPYAQPQYAPQQPYAQPEPQYAPQQPYAQPEPQYAPQQPYAQPGYPPVSAPAATPPAYDEEEGTTVLSDNRPLYQYPYLVRRNTKEQISINKPVFRIGRERSYVDCFISNNNAISRSHADIITRANRYYICDKNSANKTYRNGLMLTPEEETEIFDGDVLQLANEEFEFHKS